MHSTWPDIRYILPAIDSAIVRYGFSIRYRFACSRAFVRKCIPNRHSQFSDLGSSERVPQMLHSKRGVEKVFSFQYDRLVYFALSLGSPNPSSSRTKSV